MTGKGNSSLSPSLTLSMPMFVNCEIIDQNLQFVKFFYHKLCILHYLVNAFFLGTC